MSGGIWLIDENGQEYFVAYEDLESEQLKQILRPVGGFCYEAESFMHLPLAETPFYIKGWLPKQGKAEIYAPAKAGKSYLALQLADALGGGKEFLGIPTTQATVLYLQFELVARKLQDRMKSEMQLGFENVFVGTSFSMKLDTKGGQGMLDRALEAVKPSVLILDPLYKLISTGEESEGKVILPILDFLDQMIETYECSVLLIHHSGKDIARGGRGWSGLEGWVDSCIEMKRLKGVEGFQAEITPKLLRHGDLPIEPILVEFVDYKFERRDYQPTVKAEVADYLERNEGMSISPKVLFAAKLGSRASIQNALTELVQEGLVERVAQGMYQWIGGRSND